MKKSFFYFKNDTFLFFAVSTLLSVLVNLFRDLISIVTSVKIDECTSLLWSHFFSGYESRISSTFKRQSVRDGFLNAFNGITFRKVQKAALNIIHSAIICIDQAHLTGETAPKLILFHDELDYSAIVNNAFANREYKFLRRFGLNIIRDKSKFVYGFIAS